MKFPLIWALLAFHALASLTPAKEIDAYTQVVNPLTMSKVLGLRKQKEAELDSIQNMLDKMENSMERQQNKIHSKLREMSSILSSKNNLNNVLQIKSIA